MKMKTVSYEFHAVWNDIKGTHFNGLKTFITENTNIHKVFRKFQRAKPIKSLTWIYKRIKDFLPKVKDYFNMTGGNTTYKTVQFSVNPKTKEHTYAHNLQNFSQVKKWIIIKGKKIFRKFLKNNKKVFISNSFRKRYRLVDANGYHFKIKNRKIFTPYKKKKKFIDNSSLAKKLLRVRTYIKKKYRKIKEFITYVKKPIKKIKNMRDNTKHYITWFCKKAIAMFVEYACLRTPVKNPKKRIQYKWFKPTFKLRSKPWRISPKINYKKVILKKPTLYKGYRRRKDLFIKSFLKKPFKKHNFSNKTSYKRVVPHYNKKIIKMKK
jgi:hypothetical protein